ncbi:MAG: carboxypeptidase-like regulatory domain-containing protein [Prevotellaceae bacterium]|jgi:5-hydroxyisourate hydrolase-like protein (transthyretin family)|nr:carboxypeptidase-like regulatory domain-containing protein [Prevotellaceae bacterium]
MKKIKIISVLSILSCLWMLYCISSCDDKDSLAVQGNIEGTVTDYKTGQAVSGVMVDIVSNNSTTFIKQTRQTGNNGKFSFKNIEAGDYKLSFSRSGYSENNQDVRVFADQTVPCDIALRPLEESAVSNQSPVALGF